VNEYTDIADEAIGRATSLLRNGYDGYAGLVVADAYTRILGPTESLRDRRLRDDAARGLAALWSALRAEHKAVAAR